MDHFCFFILRLLRIAHLNPGLQNKLDLDPIKILDYQVLAYRIEHIADNAASLANQIIPLHGENLFIPEDVLELITKAGSDAYKQLTLLLMHFLIVKSLNATQLSRKKTIY